jgi:hypothetical protein
MDFSFMVYTVTKVVGDNCAFFRAPFSRNRRFQGINVNFQRCSLQHNFEIFSVPANSDSG